MGKNGSANPFLTGFFFFFSVVIKVPLSKGFNGASLVQSQTSLMEICMCMCLILHTVFKCSCLLYKTAGTFLKSVFPQSSVRYDSAMCS